VAPTRATPSIVIASNRDRALLGRCLEALQSQAVTHHAEVLVARAGLAADAESLSARFPAVRFVAAEAGAAIPRLRGLGLAAATGDPVLLTEDHCVPAADWVARILPAATAGVMVIGGGMATAPAGRPLDRAAYLADYGLFSHSRPWDPESSGLITAANVAYARPVVRDVAEWYLKGQWENVAHDRLRARGATFRFVPEARVVHDQRYRFRTFWWDRFSHGYDYARARLTEAPNAHRWIRCVGAPLLGPVLLWRIARAAFRENRVGFLLALPYTVGFLSGWATGEAVGYFRGPWPDPA